jgi:hypothetical protein
MPGFDFEVSHDAMRPPPRPRMSDLTAPTVDERSRGRAAHGRFGPGNAAASGRGWKAIIRGRIRAGIQHGAPGAEDVERLVQDAWLLYTGALKELPSTGQHVRSLLALKVQHETLGAWWQAQAFKRGIGTKESIAAEDRFAVHSRRVEQLTASVLGASKALAVPKRGRNGLEILRARILKGGK